MKCIYYRKRQKECKIKKIKNKNRTVHTKIRTRIGTRRGMYATLYKWTVLYCEIKL